MKSLALLILLLNISGCSWQTPRGPSILVIAIESLGADSFYCGKPDSEFADGLGLLCADGVRFTHAYTPSTMSQAAMASVFTGMYPKDTGVRHNGSQYLS
ncbi:MAG: sulfatase-like hydrolase/transferase, partial [Bdellovibrionales bacterium]